MCRPFNPASLCFQSCDKGYPLGEQESIAWYQGIVYREIKLFGI